MAVSQLAVILAMILAEITARPVSSRGPLLAVLGPDTPVGMNWLVQAGALPPVTAKDRSDTLSTAVKTAIPQLIHLLHEMLLPVRVDGEVLQTEWRVYDHVPCQKGFDRIMDGESPSTRPARGQLPSQPRTRRR